VLQVTRTPQLRVDPDAASLHSAAVTFRPIGTLAHATPRRLLVRIEGGASAPTQAVCIAIDGHTRVLPVGATCQ
jgi:hypothetical protein